MIGQAKIYVAGHRGMVGSAIVRTLQAQCQSHGVDYSSAGTRPGPGLQRLCQCMNLKTTAQALAVISSKPLKRYTINFRGMYFKNK
jgi:nucleoside-diphosphate-sugar epimerase